MYGICSDITTTFPISGKFNQKQKDIYNIVLKAQKKSISLIKIGSSYSSIQDIAFKIILEGLKELNVLKGEIDEMFEEKIHFLFMPHSLGHYIGFRTHDVGFTRELNSTLPIEEQYMYEPVTRDILKKGIITTVEPGIYFIEMLKQKAIQNEKQNKFINFDKWDYYFEVGGVRIEDCIYLDEDGGRILTEVK